MQLIDVALCTCVHVYMCTRVHVYLVYMHASVVCPYSVCACAGPKVTPAGIWPAMEPEPGMLEGLINDAFTANITCLGIRD